MTIPETVRTLIDNLKTKYLNIKTALGSPTKSRISLKGKIVKVKKFIPTALYLKDPQLQKSDNNCHVNILIPQIPILNNKYSNINEYGNLLQMSKPRTVTARNTNQDLTLLTMKIKDRTGSARISLWGDKAETLQATVGSAVAIDRAIRDVWNNKPSINTKPFTTIQVGFSTQILKNNSLALPIAFTN